MDFSHKANKVKKEHKEIELPITDLLKTAYCQFLSPDHQPLNTSSGAASSNIFPLIAQTFADLKKELQLLPVNCQLSEH